uniref:RRM domain-containing protein n=1 Tax=Oryza nivara TaxID=4536 RepID=A0A0E0J0B2_ORYNI
MSDRQQSEEPEEQVDLEGDDDNDVMDDDEDGYRRRRRREDSDEPDDDEEDPEVEGDGHGDTGTAAGEGGADEMDKAAAAGGGGGDGPEDDDEKRKWDELLALPPQGSEVFIGGLPRDTTEEDLRELCDSFGEIYEVRLMKDKETKENKGFAFGRTLRCSLSQAKHRLFVGNVDTIPTPMLYGWNDCVFGVSQPVPILTICSPCPQLLHAPRPTAIFPLAA